MSLAGYRALSVVDDRATPAEVFGPLDERFAFTLDACASAANAKCERYFTAGQNGLNQSWAGERVWVNPPYSHPNLSRWADKAWQQHEAADLIVMLVPANRTDQEWWQKHVEPRRDRPGSPLRTEFLPGRTRFLARGQSRTSAGERPQFGCCLLIWQAAS